MRRLPRPRVLTVAEPTDNGSGGDAFALVWHEGALYGLNGSGRSPAVLEGARHDEHGPRSVTVPGAVRAWADLAERFGRLGLDRALAAAADLAELGVACTARIAHKWATHDPGAVARAGDRRALPPARARDDAAPHRDRRPRRVLRGGGRRRNRVVLLALRGRSRGAPLRVGRAAAARVPRRRGLRAAAERTGRGGADRARPLRRARADAALADRGDEARARRRLRVRARRAAAAGAARSRRIWPRAVRSSARIGRPSPSLPRSRKEARRTCARSTGTARRSR